MTTQAASQFALSFSNDAVHLLERTAPPESAAPWRERGRALFDAHDFRVQIGVLRDATRQANGNSAPVALVIPDDQILYTSVEAAGVRDGTKVGEALDGLTPYAVDELAWDWRADGADGVRVAAVARQTLREAEDFARRYGFAPGGFVANPPAGVYPGAPRFSMSSEDVKSPLSDDDTLPGDELAAGGDAAGDAADKQGDDAADGARAEGANVEGADGAKVRMPEKRTARRRATRKTPLPSQWLMRVGRSRLRQCRAMNRPGRRLRRSSPPPMRAPSLSPNPSPSPSPGPWRTCLPPRRPARSRPRSASLSQIWPGRMSPRATRTEPTRSNAPTRPPRTRRPRVFLRRPPVRRLRRHLQS